MKSFILKHKYDITLISVLVLISLVLLAVFSLGRKHGDTVKVTVNGETFGVYSLDKDAIIDINGTNLLVIKDKEAYMESADCPNLTCVKHHPISKSGQSIICLPNRVVVTVTEKDGYADAVAE